MKKSISILVGVVFITVMILNISVGVNQNGKNNIHLRNMEALACFPIEYEGQPMGQCCFPYWNTCWVVNLNISIAGTWTI